MSIRTRAFIIMGDIASTNVRYWPEADLSVPENSKFWVYWLWSTVDCVLKADGRVFSLAFRSSPLTEKALYGCQDSLTRNIRWRRILHWNQALHQVPLGLADRESTLNPALLCGHRQECQVARNFPHDRHIHITRLQLFAWVSGPSMPEYRPHRLPR